MSKPDGTPTESADAMDLSPAAKAERLRRFRGEVSRCIEPEFGVSCEGIEVSIGLHDGQIGANRDCCD